MLPASRSIWANNAAGMNNKETNRSVNIEDETSIAIIFDIVVNEITASNIKQFFVLINDIRSATN
ncbi:MAG: hypothetical protein NXI08_00100 [bacterium]|nr:hypothetical protein [bacterium]